VPARQRNHHRFVEQRLDDKPFRIGWRSADERNIHPLVAQLVKELVAQGLFQCQGHLRTSFAERADRARHQRME
jgi:hypothetical protein